MCYKLHEYANHSRFEDLKNKIRAESGLRHFYDKNNQSLMSVGLKKSKSEILKHIGSQISIGYHECMDICEKTQDSHIIILKSKCKIGNTECQTAIHWKAIDDAFSMLNEIDICSKILKFTALWKKLKILFDFKQDTNFYSDPEKSIHMPCTAYSSGVIYIGAKNLITENSKLEVIARLIHELFHLTLMLTYMNSCNPYSVNSPSKAIFEKDVVALCEKYKSTEKIIEKVFNLPKEFWHSELIVTAVEMLVIYAENYEKVKELEQKFVGLFKYVRDVVVDKMDKAIPILVNLQNDSKLIKFDDLTKTMKSKIIDAKIIFQGVETSFSKLFGSDKDVPTLLTHSDFQECLIKGQKIKVCDLKVAPLKSQMIKRKFISTRLELILNIKDEDMEVNKSLKNYMQIKSDVENTKAFLLAENCSKSKTATFEDLAVKLKDSFRSHWLCYIKIKDHREIIEQFQKAEKKINSTRDSLDVFFNLVKLDTEIECKMFKKLFFNHKMILMLDGIDDLGPECLDFLIKVVNKIKADTRNQLWISFNQANIRLFEDLFKVNAFKPVEIVYRKEKRRIIEEVLKTLKFKNAVTRVRKAQEILIIVDKMEEKLSFLCSITDTLMLEAITKLFIEGSIDQYFTNIFEAYEKIIAKHMEKVVKEVKNGDLLMKFHQVFGLKSTLSTNYDAQLGFKIDNLTIIQSWDKEKYKWKKDDILNFGFVKYDPDGKDSFDFSNKSYGEFFVSQLIITSFFKSEKGIKESELENIGKILEIIDKESKIFPILRIFLLDYMRELTKGCDESIYENVQKIQRNPIKVNKSVQKIIIQHSLGLIKDNFSALNLKSLEFWSVFLMIDPVQLKILWRVEERNDMLVKILSGDMIENADEFKKFIQLVDDCFGNEWHQLFDKTGKKLISDDEIEKYEDKFDVNFLKLLSFMEENRKGNNEKLFYSKLFQLRVFKFVHIKVMNKILLTICEIFKDNKADFEEKIIKLVEFYALKPANDEGLLYFGENIEEVLDNNKESIRKVLFYDYRSEIHPLIQAIKSENMENFITYRNLYVKYKESWDEIQDIFIKYSIIFKEISFIHDNITPDFVKFVMKAFFNSQKKLKSYAERYLKDGWHNLIRKNALKHMLDLMKFAYGDSDFNALEISGRFTTFNDFII